MIDAVTLSRIQFGVAVGFHYLFPITTLGLTLFQVIFESLYLFRKDECSKRVSAFLVRMIALVFVLGVASGITLPFAFGANWAGFSRFAGDVFGLPLAIEGMTAFTFESLFIALLVLGRNRLSPRVYWGAGVAVFLSAHLSGFWIISANSWMQTPAGFAIENGRAVLTDPMASLFNPSTVLRFMHAIAGGWLTGAVIVCSLGAWYLLHGRDTRESRGLLRAGIIVLCIMPLVQLLIGHFHSIEVEERQPMKSAAYEGIFTAQRGAPLYVFGIPDQKNRTVRLPVGIPKFLSFLYSGDFNSPVHGLDEYPESEWPPVNVVFTSFRLMEMVGFLLIGVGLVGGLLLVLKRAYTERRYLWLLVALTPLPYLSNEMGWMGTEIGRQHWIVYGLMRTENGCSATVGASQVLLTLIGLSCIYIVIFLVFLKLIRAIVKDGPVVTAAEEK